MLKLVITRVSRHLQDFKKPQYFQSVRLLSDFDLNFYKDASESHDKFGTLSQIQEDISRPVDEGDIEEEKFLTEKPYGYSPTTKQYADKIKAFIRVNKLKEAFDVVEVEMVKENRDKPCNYLYNLLIGACGRAGYTKKAFQLYNTMKNRGLKITGGTYTALFNACSNSPWSVDGLTRALHLRDIIIQIGYQPNESNYNAMIKAFGRCGDLETAFSIVDEIMEKRLPLKPDTFNFLLQGCISDKESGFRHALLVWQKMVRKCIQPDKYSFALLLKCTHDCSTGDLSLFRDTTLKIVSNGPNVKQIEANTSDEQLVKVTNEHSVNKIDDTDQNHNLMVPNLLLKNPHFGNALNISEIKDAKDRLLLLGGQKGFLETMVKFGVEPTIKTMTQLLMIIPNTEASEKMLLNLCKDYNIQLDLEFYNMLIKKRAFRHDYESAMKVLKLIEREKMQPDLITFGVLAIACWNADEAFFHINMMLERGYRLNNQILGAMLRQACYNYDFAYVYLIMETAEKEHIYPSERFLEILSEFKEDCTKIKKATPSFKRKFKKFKSKYENWLKKVQSKEKKEDTHPWSQYRKNSDTVVKKAIRSKIDHFQARHLNYFKQKEKDFKTKSVY